MFAAEWRWQGVWHSFPFLAWALSMHPRTQIWFFNQFKWLEHVHVVQIWIMHINALKTQLMHKNVQTNHEKSQKMTQHSCCSTLTLEKFWKQEEATYIVLSTKLTHFPTRTLRLLVRSSGLWETFTITYPKWDNRFYPSMLMPFHDSMPRFMNFRRVLDLLELQKQVSQSLLASHCAEVFEIQPHFLHGT